MTQRQFLDVTKWTKKDLRRFCHDVTVQLGHDSAIPRLLEFRKEIQIACSKYGKTNKFNNIQMNSIRLCELIAKWCHEYFVLWSKNQILKDKPKLLFEPQKLKGLANKLWEEYVRKNSY